MPNLAAQDAAAGHILDRLQQSISAPADQQQQIGLPGTGPGAGRHEDVAREDAGKGEAALYADLDALQEEASAGLGDASENGEVDAESLQDRRLTLGEARGVPSPVVQVAGPRSALAVWLTGVVLHGTAPKAQSILLAVAICWTPVVHTSQGLHA